MKVLVACEFSGVVRDAFLERGHDAMSCDLLPTDRPGPHYQGDVRDVLGDGWDLMIAHPPCTYLTLSGVWLLHRDPDRWDRMREAASFFAELYNAPIPRVCVENPVMHRYAREAAGIPKATQYVQPWQFGHPETKMTGLWLRGLPKLRETNNVYDDMMRLPPRERHRLALLPPSPDRWKIRSTTFPGIAAAMADQWGSLDD